MHIFELLDKPPYGDGHDESVFCDNCEKDIVKGVQFYHCAPCEEDYCIDCYQNQETKKQIDHEFEEESHSFGSEKMNEMSQGDQP